MANRLEVRNAVEADLPDLLALYAQLHPEDRVVADLEAQSTLKTFELYDGSAGVVGLHEDVVVSTCCLIAIPNLTRGGRALCID